MKELEQRCIPRDPMPNRIAAIGTVTTNRNDAWRAIYAEELYGEIIPDLRPVAAWCSALTSHGNVIGYSPDDGTYAVYGLVIVGNRLEICDTHADFIAYTRSSDRAFILELVNDWVRTKS